MPFTAEQFFGVFRTYNEAIWPAQVVLLAAALVATALAVSRGRAKAPWIWGFLGALWIWTGAVYHFAHFRAINPAATAFAALFVLQGGLLLWRGARVGGLPFQASRDGYGAAAGALIVYALAVYPVVGLLAGHGYFGGPTFGAPCPVVIYTFGMLLLAPGAPAWLFAIPLAWAALGWSAVTAFGVVQDVGLPVGAAVVIVALVLRRRERRAVARAPEATAHAAR